MFVIELHQNPAYWTNYTYLYLFGKIANEIRKEWQTINGKPDIARNHIPKALGLESVGFVERTVVDIYTGDLKAAHDLAIEIAIKKYELPIMTDINPNKLFSYPTLKLSNKEINDIIELCQSGEFTQTEIALSYQVTGSTISYHYQRWLKRE